MSVASGRTADVEILHPLPLVYGHEGLELPAIEVVPAGVLSSKANQLLVHIGDMTSKLEAFYGDEMILRALHRERDNGSYRREVLLCAKGSGLPVEYGAIEICLDAFPENLQQEIVEERRPLGGLLNSHGVKYRSQPKAFVRVTPDARLMELFGLSEPTPLFGRCNELLDGDDRTLARIVEILRPV